MTPWTLADIEHAIRAAWGADTCPPEDLARWHPGNPARGQCGVTALVVHDLLGGDLQRGEVHVDGMRTDFHWWNLLPGGIEVDLTREQFTPQEHVTDGTLVTRPAGVGRLEAQYVILRDRVLAALGVRRP